jgi:hypothetical protein
MQLMLNSITWKEYTEFIVCTLIVYYAVVGWLFRKEVMQWAFRKKIVASTPGSFFRDNLSGVDEAEPGVDFNINLFESCMEDLNRFFEKAKGRSWIKEELIFALRKILINYKALKDTSNEEIIRQIIIIRCKAISSVHISEGDWNQLWLDM